MMRGVVVFQEGDGRCPVLQNPDNFLIKVSGDCHIHYPSQHRSVNCLGLVIGNGSSDLPKEPPYVTAALFFVQYFVDPGAELTCLTFNHGIDEGRKQIASICGVKLHGRGQASELRKKEGPQCKGMRLEQVVGEFRHGCATIL